MHNINWGLLSYALITSREGSASRAATEMGVTHATIIRGLKKLEENTATKLFNKSPSGYTPTEQGNRLIQVANEIDSLINTWLQEVEETSHSISGALRLSTTDLIANGYLCPNLPNFYKSYPDIELEITTSYDFCSLTRYEADVAIRSTESPPEHLIGRHLTKVSWGIYQSSSQNMKAGETNWIGAIDKSTMPARWLLELHPNARIIYKAHSITNHIEAAKFGLGKVLLPCFAADNEPLLVKVDQLPNKYSTNLWLLYNKELKSNPKVKAFVHWIYEQLKHGYI